MLVQLTVLSTNPGHGSYELGVVLFHISRKIAVSASTFIRMFEWPNDYNDKKRYVRLNQITED
jgi:hypothetical protein